jgi:nitrite reductase (NADH) large subunit
MERQLDEGGRQAAAEVARSARPEVPARKSRPRRCSAGESGRVARVRFKDGMRDSGRPGGHGRRHPPQHALAESCRLHCNRGIVVNDTLQTYRPAHLRVGECAAHRGIAYGLVAPLFEQAKVCANHLAHFGIGRYTGSVTSTKLKVTGIDLFSAGNFRAARAPRKSSSTTRRRRVQEAGDQGRQAGRRRACTATRPTALVLQAAEGRPEHSPTSATT